MLGTVHSIPMLAFYGNWSDPSMFDRGTYIGRLYGDQTPTYVASLTDNSLGIKYPGDTDVYYYAGNPYMVEDSYPAGREAISMETTVYSQQVSLIRNAAAVTTMVTNQDGEYLYIADPVTLVNGASTMPIVADGITPTIPSRSISGFLLWGPRRVTP